MSGAAICQAGQGLRGAIHKHLCVAGGSGCECRGRIKIRIGIEERTAIVESRRCISDWELDTMPGKNGRQVIVAVVERKSHPPHLDQKA